MYARAWFLLLPRCVWAVNILQHALTPIGILIRFDVTIFALFKQTHTDMKFIKLTHDSSVEDAKTYLVQLAQSPYHYHLDDELTEDFNWGCTPPDPETLKVMQSNADILWWMHLNDIMKWDDTWDVYHDAWKDHERKQSIENA